MKVTSVIVKEIYPIVEKAMGSNYSKYKNYLKKFFEARSADIYDISPCARIFFGAEDTKDYFKALNINDKEILGILHKAYFWDMDFNPRCIKSPLVPVQMMVIRYFLIKNKEKDAEISSIYLAFTGQFYPSIHSRKFIYPPARHVMDYVVNNLLTQKFDLKREGNVFGAMRSLCKTWIDTYKNKLKNNDADDEDVADIIQQLHGRIKSSLGNVASVYYDVYEKQDQFLTYDSDSKDDSDFRIADNDSLKAERYVENTMNLLSTQAVNYQLCRLASDSNVKTDEVKSIIESIQDDPRNIPIVKELLRITVTEYMAESLDKSVSTYQFVAKSIAPKPNTKNPNIVRQKQIIENWLDENSPQYRKRKSREATKSSYHKSLLKYYVLMINKANKGL